jgi:hypothetical protein
MSARVRVSCMYCTVCMYIHRYIHTSPAIPPHLRQRFCGASAAAFWLAWLCPWHRLHAAASSKLSTAVPRDMSQGKAEDTNFRWISRVGLSVDCAEGVVRRGHGNVTRHWENCIPRIWFIEFNFLNTLSTPSLSPSAPPSFHLAAGFPRQLVSVLCNLNVNRDVGVVTCAASPVNLWRSSIQTLSAPQIHHNARL